MPAPRKEKIVILAGDGIGPEVCAEAVKVLRTINDLRSSRNGVAFELVDGLIGGAAIEATGK
jgi:3-isopropylmalate dehydrogenase